MTTEALQPIRGKLREIGLVKLMDGSKVKGVIIEIDCPSKDWTIDAIFGRWEVEISVPVPQST